MNFIALGEGKPLVLAVSMQVRTEVNEGNEDLAWLEDTDGTAGPAGIIRHRLVAASAVREIHSGLESRPSLPCCETE